MTRRGRNGNSYDDGGAPWGIANERRGRAHLAEALAFVTLFPIGTKLSNDEFDRFCHDQQLLIVPFGYPKTSDAWRAHVERRQKVRAQINVSGAHPRLIHQGATPFVIDSLGSDMLEVNSPEDSIVIAGATPKIAQALATKRAQIARLYQSVDFDKLPPHHRAQAELLFEDVDMLADSFTSQVAHLSLRFSRFKARVESEITRRNQAQISNRSSGDEEVNHHPSAQ